MKKILVLLIAVLVMGTASMSFAFDEGQEKNSWYIGFGIGTGNGEISSGGSDYSWDEAWPLEPSILSVNLGIGGVINPSFHLGLEMTGTRLTFSESGLEGWFQFNSYLLAASFFPMERGFFLKAGLGLAAAIAGGDISADSESGTAVMAGIGYFFNFGSDFNLGVHFDYTLQSYEDMDQKFYNFYVSFYWF